MYLRICVFVFVYLCILPTVAWLPGSQAVAGPPPVMALCTVAMATGRAAWPSSQEQPGHGHPQGDSPRDLAHSFG